MRQALPSAAIVPSIQTTASSRAASSAHGRKASLRLRRPKWSLPVTSGSARECYQARSAAAWARSHRPRNHLDCGYGLGFKPMAPPRKAPAGANPTASPFSPDGATLALGYADAAVVELFDGHSLEPLPGPDTGGLGNGSLSQVMWSKDGGTLDAGGLYHDGRDRPVLAWANAGRGKRRALPAGRNTVGGLAALPDGGLLVAATDPLLAVLEA